MKKDIVTLAEAVLEAWKDYISSDDSPICYVCYFCGSTNKASWDKVEHEKYCPVTLAKDIIDREVT